MKQVYFCKAPLLIKKELHAITDLDFFQSMHEKE
jgi:hypothetical protein